MKKIMVCLFLFTACQNLEKKAEYNIQGDTTTAPGYVSVFQTATSDTETTINIMRPHLAKLKYEVEGLGEQKIIQTVSGPKIFWKVDRIHIKGLKTGKPYRLNIKKRRKVVDWREFKTLDIKSKKAKFVVGSCMSDDFKFEHVRNKIWHRMMSQSPDFLMLLGDQVYVDSFDFVKRETATEFEIWRRYVDSFRKIPLFQMRQLVPIFAVWDDHDFGTNNSNKTFKARKAAEKVFTAFFGGVNIKGVFEGAKTGVFSSFDGFGHRFLLMDNRYFREPKKEAAYGHWGKDQHQWFKEKLSKSDKPLWLAHGGQFFAPATFVDRKNGTKKQINESLLADHPNHYKTLMNDIKQSKMPVAFLSGDIHFSEIVGVKPDVLGYQTYEVTSSPIHSFLFRTKPGSRKYLDNPGRIVAHKDHNYVIIESEVVDGGLNFKAASYGVTQDPPYFEKQFKIKK